MATSKLFGYFCVQQKKDIHTGLEQHEGEWVNDKIINIFG